MATQPSRRRLPRFRIGLRTLLLLTLVIGSACGIFVRRWYQDYRERQAIEAISQARGRLLSLEQGGWRVYLAGPDIDDEQLASLVPHLEYVRGLSELDLVSTSTTPAGLAELRHLASLKDLYLYNAETSPEVLDQLRAAIPGLNIHSAEPDPVPSRLAGGQIYRHAIVALAINQATGVVLTGSGDGKLREWVSGEDEPERTWNAHADWLFSIALSPDGRTIATGGGDNVIRLWSNAGRAARRSTIGANAAKPGWDERPELLGELLGHEDDVHAVRFAGPSTLVSTGDDCTVRVWKLDGSEQPVVLRGHTRSIPALDVDAAGELAASGSRDSTIRLWNLPRGEGAGVLTGHTADVNALAFSPQGDRIASASYDRTLRLWDVRTQRSVATFVGHTDRVHAVAFSPDGQQLVSGSRDGTLRLWDVASGACIDRFEVQRNVSAIVFADDGMRVLTAAAEGNWCVWRTGDWKLEQIVWTRPTERGMHGLAAQARR